MQIGLITRFFEIDEILGSARGVTAYRLGIRGRYHEGQGGGDFEIAIGLVTVWRDGKVASNDIYESADREAMLARFAELTRDPVQRPV